MLKKWPSTPCRTRAGVITNQIKANANTKAKQVQTQNPSYLPIVFANRAKGCELNTSFSFRSTLLQATTDADSEYQNSLSSAQISQKATAKTLAVAGCLTSLYILEYRAAALVSSSHRSNKTNQARQSEQC